MRIALILNGDAGTLKGADPKTVGEELAGIFRTQGHTVIVEVAAGKAAVEAIERTFAAQAFDAIVVAGGDGTVSAAAAAAVESEAALGVVPLGTMNFFARSLGIPMDRNEAAKALALGELAAVDIGTVNGRTFVHAVALGLHPAMVEARSTLEYGSRYGKMLASLRAFVFAVRHQRRFRIRIETDATTIERRTAGVVVSNNPLGEGHAPFADGLEDGRLAIYVTSAKGWFELARVATSAALGSAASHPLVEVHETKKAEIITGRRATPVTIDGELVVLTGPMSFESVHRGLNVLRPRSNPEL